MNNAQNIVLIPAYEPGPPLIRLLYDLSDHGNLIVVIDDGSGGDYLKVFDEVRSQAVVLTHKENLGKGAALKTGLAYIEKHCGPNSVIVTVDADGQHRAKDAMKLCEVARKHPDTLVLGSRKFRGRIPLRSRFGNTVTRLVYRISTGLKVYDTQTGLRAFHKQLLPQMLEIPGARYEYEINVLLEMAKTGVPIMEEEIETIYLDRDNSSSHFDTVRDSFRVYREILRFSASSLISFIVDYALYGILILSTGDLRLSNVGARIISASTNYLLNRKFVFRSNRGLIRSAFSYFLFAVTILAGNTLVLEYLVVSLGIDRLIAKIMTEILFFTFSWFIQRSFVFRGRKGAVI